MLTLKTFKISECLFSTDRLKQVSLFVVILLSSEGVSLIEVLEGLKMRRGVHCLGHAYISDSSDRSSLVWVVSGSYICELCSFHPKLS